MYNFVSSKVDGIWETVKKSLYNLEKTIIYSEPQKQICLFFHGPKEIRFYKNTSNLIISINKMKQ